MQQTAVGKRFDKLSRVAALTLSALFVTAPAAIAKTRPGASEPCVQVVGSLPLDGFRADRLFVRQGARGKRYLYAVPSFSEGSASQGVLVINISDPAHPKLESRTLFEGQAQTRDVMPVGVNAAIINIAMGSRPAQLAANQEEAPLREIGVMDLSDPANPKIACRFKGVSGYFSDDAKSLIYIVNSEGLWVVSHREPPDVSVEAWEKFAAAP